ncbi:MAG: tRNA (guanosine(37)-N1)-methyltransferase TrmD [Elusimicrobiota bacterium]
MVRARARAPGPLRIDFVTLFPRMFEGPLSESILRRAAERGLVEFAFTDPREFSEDRHHTVDDRPYGGGAGMVMMAEPLYRALKKVRKRGSKVVLLSAQGARYDQRTAERLSREKHLVLVCGHYEGVDERILEHVDLELSVGDYVLTGGEIPAMVVADSVTRLIPGVLKKPDASARESFSTGLLDYPQYTRPSVWRGRKVPEILLGGDHAKIEAWRLEAALAATKRKRPDLLAAAGVGKRRRKS